MYRGQFELRYTVNERDYFIWADAGWLDTDKQFVRQKLDPLPKSCDFVVRYNPRSPEESVASRREGLRSP